MVNSVLVLQKLGFCSLQITVKVHTQSFWGKGKYLTSLKTNSICYLFLGLRHSTGGPIVAFLVSLSVCLSFCPSACLSAWLQFYTDTAHYFQQNATIWVTWKQLRMRDYTAIYFLAQILYLPNFIFVLELLPKILLPNQIAGFF